MRHDRSTARLARLALAWCLGSLVWQLPARAAQIAVVTDPSNPQKSSWVERAATRAGLSYVSLTPSSLARAGADCRLAVVASQQELSDSAANWLLNFHQRGGSLVVFAPLHPSLAGIFGVREAEAPITEPAARLGPLRFSPNEGGYWPEQWSQNTWEYQPITVSADRVVGWWQPHDQRADGSIDPNRPLALQPGVVVAPGGVFVAAVPNGDDLAAESNLLLTAATWHQPELWHTALPNLLSTAGRIADCDSLGELSNRLVGSDLSFDRRARARSELNSAMATLANARSAYETAKAQAAAAARPPAPKNGAAAPVPGAPLPPPPPPPPPLAPAAERYLPVARAAWQAHLAAERAYCLSVPPVTGEFSGVWIQNAGGIRGWGWTKTAQALANNGIKNVFVNVANGGYANYPSAVLPYVTVEGADPLAEAVAACHKVGVRVHGWVMTTFLRPATPLAWRRQLTSEGRLQGEAGGTYSNWLSPADERNRELMREVCRELASRYQLDGLQFDYVRFGTSELGVGPEERAAYEQASMSAVLDWPGAVLRPGPERANWDLWRAKQVNRLVQAMTEGARAGRPDIELSAAVWPIWVDAYHDVGQDPAEWADRGWVDFLCPMNYHTNDARFRDYFAIQQRAATSQVPLYPGIAAWRQERGADTVGQIRQLREMGAKGFVLFHLDQTLAEQVLPLMALGVTSREP